MMNRDDVTMWAALNLGDPDDIAWMARGACKGSDEFFPGRGVAHEPSKTVCAACPVKAQCLEYALVHDERYGIWGGASEAERRKLKKQREQAAGSIADDLDPRNVDMALLGLPVDLTKDEREEVARRMHAAGKDLYSISKATGFNYDSLRSKLGIRRAAA